MDFVCPITLYARSILETLGNPILSASLPGDMVEEYTDPEIIFEKFGKLVDFVIDGGIGGVMPSTVVDCTTDEWTVIRQGLVNGEHKRNLHIAEEFKKPNCC